MVSFQFLSAQGIYRLTVVVLIAVWCLTLISFFGHHAYLELATHFRLQYAFLSAACILLLINSQSWKLLPFAVVCALLNSTYVLPYYSRDFSPVGYTAGTRLRVMQANVLGSNRNYAALLRSVAAAHPDVVVLQELTDEWAQQIKVLDSEYPHSKVVPKVGGSGMAILSRYPLDDVQVLAFDPSTHLALSRSVR